MSSMLVSLKMYLADIQSNINVFRLLQHFSHDQFIGYSLANGDKHEQNSVLRSVDI